VRRQRAQVRAPALIVHADEDDVASPKSAELVERSISSAFRRKVMLHDSYHIITLDNEKATVARETVEFFGQHVPAFGAGLRTA
jgi:carboxylesterase